MALRKYIKEFDIFPFANWKTRVAKDYVPKGIEGSTPSSCTTPQDGLDKRITIRLLVDRTRGNFASTYQKLEILKS